VRSIPLNASAQVVLDGSGNGMASVGPTAQGETWTAGFVAAVHCSSNAAEAQCRVYAGGGASPAYFIGGTVFGSTGDSTSDTPQMQVGQNVFAVWQGGDPGATATLSINGMRNV
jgi:hypothetical protein